MTKAQLLPANACEHLACVVATAKEAASAVSSFLKSLKVHFETLALVALGTLEL